MTSGKPGSQCTSYPCLIFEDEFDSLNLDVWEHEITASGGGVRITKFLKHFDKKKKKKKSIILSFTIT